MVHDLLITQSQASSVSKWSTFACLRVTDLPHSSRGAVRWLLLCFRWVFP